METGRVEGKTSEEKTGWSFSGLLTRIGGVFLAPDATFKQIITGKIGFWEPFLLVLLLVGVQVAVVASFCFRIMAAILDSISTLTSGVSFSFLSVMLAVMFTVSIIGALILWFVVAIIAHLIARFVFHGRGSLLQLMKLYGYSIIPCSLQILGLVLVGMSWTLWPFLVFFHAVAAFWIVVLMAVAVKHTYDIDIGKGFISSFIGPMTLWLIMIGIAWAWTWVIMRSFAGGLSLA
jgi:hypothetical protein